MLEAEDARLAETHRRIVEAMLVAQIVAELGYRPAVCVRGKMAVERARALSRSWSARVVRYFTRERPELLAEFQNIAEITSTLPQSAA